MFILVPILIVIALVVAIDQIYFSDVTPKDSSKKQIHQKANDTNATQHYLDRYIKNNPYM